ncbi:hypothetical protein ATO12_00375 [Aquimarina atlantica]|uniref:Thrombospondin n=1 Tax=Aquimarina atlantica TaxID=1317122 RepID=A0A023BZ48_9FLAO|nr:hypothetical protein [Aquimarina atlantica]EZH75265.1 hypothetical protein ATO12_00375 [Aquimarina atlantica]
MKTKRVYLSIMVFTVFFILSSCISTDDDFIERNDDDGDGVINVIDECSRTPKGVVVDAVGCPAEED